MDGMNKLKYISTEQMFEGIIVELHDASVTIDLKGRLGQLKIPRRMIISEYNLEIGQEVGFLMSYPEVLAEEPDEHYKRYGFRNKKSFHTLGDCSSACERNNF
jgi:hypothetical protein